MANKIIAALLVVCLMMVAGTEAGDAEDCYRYCWNTCIFGSWFCNKWCHTQCDNPVLWRALKEPPPKPQGLDDDARSANVKTVNWPVATEKDYQEWVKIHGKGPAQATHKKEATNKNVANKNNVANNQNKN